MDAMTLTTVDYEGLNKQIWNVVHSFARDKGLTRELRDLKQIADVAFLDAYRTFDASKACLNTWVTWRVTYALRNEARHYASLPTTQRLPPACEDVKSSRLRDHVAWQELLEGLGDDARKAATLAVYRPVRMARLLRRLGRGDPDTVRKVLAWYLSAELDWSEERITVAFVEIERRLRCA